MILPVGAGPSPEFLPPVQYRLTGEHTYPRPPTYEKLGPALPACYEDDHLCFAAARRYLASVLPSVNALPLSNEGTTAVVMHDGEWAYKIFREQGHGYDRVENHVSALVMLHREGIAPRTIALVDTPFRQRYSSLYQRAPLFGGSLEIPYVEAGGHLPIIITELRDVAPIDGLPRERRAAEFRRFADVALKHNLLYTDCRFLYNRASRQATVIDVGEVRHYSATEVDQPNSESNYSEEQFQRATIIRDALGRFLPPKQSKPTVENVADTLSTSGFRGLYAMLYAYSSR